MDADAFANAVRRQARNVIYNDYNPKDDFTLWVSGYREKVKNAFGFTNAQNDDLEAEVVRSIPGKLTSGTALDTYNQLPDATKNDYNRLIDALTKEFIDPQEKRRFVEDSSYNKRKKGQSLKEFMQEIIKDQNRYAGMRAGQEKTRDGIRRFKNGIRDRKGRKDKDQVHHLQYNLHEDDDLTWENAMKVAGRWEGANDLGSSDADSSESSDDDPVEAMEVKKKSKAKCLAKADAKKEKRTVISAIADTETAVASLTEKVETNARDIKGMKSDQERFNANVTAWKDENAATLKQILEAVQTPDSAQSQRPANTFRSNYNNNRNFNRPNSYSWKGRYNQNQQTGFRFNRNTPSSFQNAATAAAAAAAAKAAAAANTTGASKTTVGALEVDPAAQTLGAEGGEQVVLNLDQFLELSERAGEDIEDPDFMAALEQLNF